MQCPLTANWVEPDTRTVKQVLARLRRNAGARRRYAERKAQEFMREREAKVARRVMHPTEPFELR